MIGIIALPESLVKDIYVSYNERLKPLYTEEWEYLSEGCEEVFEDLYSLLKGMTGLPLLYKSEHYDGWNCGFNCYQSLEGDYFESDRLGQFSFAWKIHNRKVLAREFQASALDKENTQEGQWFCMNMYNALTAWDTLVEPRGLIVYSYAWGGSLEDDEVRRVSQWAFKDGALEFLES